MKKLTILLTFGLMFSFMSCEEFADLLQVTFEDVAIEEVINVPLQDFNMPQSRALSLKTSVDTLYFKDSLILNMDAAQEQDSSTQELADFLDDISSISIDTLSIEILKSYDGQTIPDDFELMVLHVSFYDADSLIHTETHEHVVAGDVMISPVTAEGLAGISSTLQQNKDLKVVASGAVVGDRGIDYFALKTRVVADVSAPMENPFIISE